MSQISDQLCCIVPAAGIGERMLAERPKQYLPFRSTTILDHTLRRLLSSDLIDKIILVLNKNDTYWPQSSFAKHSKITVVEGGDERADSVLKGLIKAEQLYGDTSWLLVHDAARPCILKADIERLIKVTFLNQQGAILATPIHDTVKEYIEDGVTKTLPRSKLWRALTPQLFRVKELKKALLTAQNKAVLVTDEANAIEINGGFVHLVEGRHDNLKVTTPADLLLADFYVEQQERIECE